MITGFFYSVFDEFLTDTAIIYKGRPLSYRYFSLLVAKWEAKVYISDIRAGEVVALCGDFSPNTIAILFALIENRNIIVPLPYGQKMSDKIEIANADKAIFVDEDDNVSFAEFNKDNRTIPFYEQLRKINHPGLVLFTSGSSGEPKAAVHDFVRLLEKFKVRKKAYKTLNFLLFDHWGGLNTMFHTLSNGGTVIATKDRKPDAICSYIEKYKIELLPASPTFLNMLLLSESYQSYDLSSLKLITYGTEPMPQSTLDRIKLAFPNVKLQQTYGLIELGVLRSRSKEDGSLWVYIGGEGFQTRVVNGLLEIKAESAMLGYLNAPSPFTEDGWFMTGDQVETDGEYFKILGRKSEIINVGGEKVYPVEVENVIQELPNVAEVTVFGEKNDMIGTLVCARVRLITDEDKKEFTLLLKKHCKQRLQKFKVPVKVTFDDSEQFNERFKKKRNG
jgi:long-chain acyl-CoA synthetase